MQLFTEYILYNPGGLVIDYKSKDLGFDPQLVLRLSSATKNF